MGVVCEKPKFVFVFFSNFGVPYQITTAASFAQPAEKGGRAPLLTIKYEPDVVKTDPRYWFWKWRLLIFCESANLVTSPWVVGKYYPLPDFCFRYGISYIARRLAAIFLEAPSSGTVSARKILRTRICTCLVLFGHCSWRRPGRSWSRIHFRRASAIFSESVCLTVIGFQFPFGQTVQSCGRYVLCYY